MSGQVPLPPLDWPELDLTDDGEILTNRPVDLPSRPDWGPLGLWMALAVGWLVVWVAR